MATKLLNMEFGTYQIKNGNAKLEIEKQLFKTHSIHDLEEIQEADERFLSVKISELDSSFVFEFDIHQEFYSLKNIVKENEAIRLAIARTIANQEILETSSFEDVSMNPSSIFYMPMKTVRYAYRANYLMPTEKSKSNFVKYKALILFVLTGCPYESLLDDLSAIKELKEVNPYLEQIAEAKSLSELQLILEQTENYVTYQAWRKIDAKENKWKKRTIALACALVLTNVFTMGIVKSIAKHQQEAAVNQVRNQYESQKADKQVQKAIAKKDFSAAIKLMKKKKKSNKEIAEMLFEHQQYQDALNYDSNLLETIISAYWSSENKEQILDLTLPDTAKDSEKEKLALEKSIISFNTQEMQSSLAFAEDGNSLLRMLLKYLENNDLNAASSVVRRISSIGSKEQKKYADALFEQGTNQELLKNEQANLEQANALPTSDNNRQNRIKESENKVSELETKVEKSNREVEKAKEAIETK